MNKFLLLLALFSISAYAKDGDVYIQDSDGRVVLFPLVGREVGNKGHLYGLIELNNGTSRPLCWQNDGFIIHVYMIDGSIRHYLPTDIRIDGGDKYYEAPPPALG